MRAANSSREITSKRAHDASAHGGQSRDGCADMDVASLDRGTSDVRMEPPDWHRSGPQYHRRRLFRPSCDDQHIARLPAPVGPTAGARPSVSLLTFRGGHYV